MILRDEGMNMQITVAQAVALHKLYARAPIYRTKADSNANKKMSFEDFVYEYASPSFEPGLIMVEFAGMHVGIEKDGYTHS